MTSRKVCSLTELQELLKQERAQGKTVAFANGGFDVLHLGHVRYLQAAAKEADLLVVAVNSDASLRALKGTHRAVIGEAARARILAALECVDYVVIFGEHTVDHLLLTLRPDVHCKGSDYSPETIPERQTVQSYGGRIAIVGGEKIRDSSRIIRSLQGRAADDEKG